jgi:hypothetical protein
MRRNTKVVPIFRSKLAANGSGIPQSFAITDGIPMAGSVDGFANLWVRVAASAGGGAFGDLQTAPDNADDVAVSATPDFLKTINRNTVFDGVDWDRLRSASGFNLAALSSIGAALVAKPGSWAVPHTPAAATQATASRAAGAATIRHVCTGISYGFNAINVEAGTFLINLRDGASGAGTILQSWRVGPFAAGASVRESISDLNIPGSLATAMTMEFAGAPAAGNFEFVDLHGYDATT